MILSFQLSDPAVTSKVPIGDFFAHRSGSPGDAGNDLELIGYKQETILQRLAFYNLLIRNADSITTALLD